ncbi:hypothetical protein, partial [Streptomyces sp. NPDC014734]|uniref:hypothetical protein n=1 Tax=Streptomyces sp. NPDC014734 TaxID=3364886 RepID=UPI0036F50B74
RLEEPRLQVSKIHDPRNSLNNRVLRGSIEPASPPGPSACRMRIPQDVSQIRIVQTLFAIWDLL